MNTMTTCTHMFEDVTLVMVREMSFNGDRVTMQIITTEGRGFFPEIHIDRVQTLRRFRDMGRTVLACLPCNEILF